MTLTRARASSGTPTGSVLGKSALEFVHPDDRGLVRDALAEVFAGTSPGTPTGFRVRHGDGQWMSKVDSVAANLLGTAGVDGIVTTTWPVEARRRAEEALLQSERRFRRAGGIAGLGHWELDLGSGTIHASSGAQSLYGLYGDERPLADVQGLPLPEYRPLLDRALRDLVEQGLSYEMEFAIRRADDGRERELQSVAAYDPDRRTVFGILHDITDLRGDEAALRRANRALTLLSGIYAAPTSTTSSPFCRGPSPSPARRRGILSCAAFLERSMAAGERIATLIRFTGAWEGMGARPPAWLDARAVVEDAAQEVDRGVVTVANDLPADLRVWADAICHPGRGRPHRERAPPRCLCHDGQVLRGRDRGRRPPDRLRGRRRGRAGGREGADLRARLRREQRARALSRPRGIRPDRDRDHQGPSTREPGPGSKILVPAGSWKFTPDR